MIFGAIGGAIMFIEKILVRTLPIVMDFFSKVLFNIDIAAGIKAIIKRIRKPADEVFEVIFRWLRKKVNKFRKKGKDEKKETKEESKKDMKEGGKETKKERGDKVKKKVKKELQKKLRGKFDNFEEAETVVNSLFQKYKPQGLKELKVKPTGKNQYKILARASPLVELINNIYYVKVNEFHYELGPSKVSELGPTNRYTALFIRAVRKDNQIAKNTYKVKDSKHAEENFVQSTQFTEIVKDAKEHFTKHQEKTKLMLTLDKSSCSGEYVNKNCTNILANAIRNYKEYIDFEISFVGPVARGKDQVGFNPSYHLKPGQRQKVKASIKSLIEAGADVKGTTFFSEILNVIQNEKQKNKKDQLINPKVLKKEEYVRQDAVVESYMRDLIAEAYKDLTKKI